MTQFKIAVEWTKNTGAGIDIDMESQSTKEYLRNLCPFYYELKPLLQDRPSMFANYTNESESEDNTDDENSIVTNGTDVTNHTEISGLSTAKSTPKRGNKTTPIDARNLARKQLKVSRNSLNTTLSFEDDTTKTARAKLMSAKASMLENELHEKSAASSIAKGRLLLDERRFDREEDALKLATAAQKIELNSKVADCNLKMIQSRAEALKADPSLTLETLEQIFPFQLYNK